MTRRAEQYHRGPKGAQTKNERGWAGAVQVQVQVRSGVEARRTRRGEARRGMEAVQRAMCNVQ